MPSFLGRLGSHAVGSMKGEPALAGAQDTAGRGVYVEPSMLPRYPGRARGARATTHAGMTTAGFQTIVADWIDRAKHPRWDRPYTDLIYQPML